MDLPDRLTKEIQLAFPSNTKKESFVKALTKGLQSKAYEELRKAGGKFPRLKINIHKLRDRDHYKKFL